MHACLDASYREEKVTAARVLFRDWRDDRGAREIVVRLNEAAPYIPGRFYLRELPALLAVLEKVNDPLETLIVDGYVWLDAGQSPGLGAHLYERMGGTIPVIGVAKSAYRGAPAVEVFRGTGRRPLYVTAAGMQPEEAAERIRRMHGPSRIPTLLKRGDDLCRSQRERKFQDRGGRKGDPPGRPYDRLGLAGLDMKNSGML
jgi:deoxyribonuclease V